MDIAIGFLIFAAMTVTGFLVPSDSRLPSSDLAKSDLLQGIEITQPLEVGEVGDGFSDEPFDENVEEHPPFVAPTHKPQIRSPFGNRIHPIDKTVKMHNGIDLDGLVGDNILASADGVITFAGKKNGYGNFVRIDHGKGWSSSYAHLNSIKATVKVKRKIKALETLGEMGETGDATGVHLHFEIKHHKNFIDPERLIDF